MNNNVLVIHPDDGSVGYDIYQYLYDGLGYDIFRKISNKIPRNHEKNLSLLNRQYTLFIPKYICSICYLVLLVC